MQARYQCSDVFMTELLGYMKTILPAGNMLPSTCSKAKQMIKPFQLSVQIIHACINDCILYRKDYANDDKCPKCGESRWKKPPEGSIPTSKKVLVKRLGYFPVTERLQRMYDTVWIAELMTWYAKVQESATHMRHPVDSAQQKEIDKKWPEFASEKRNVRLGLATGGFNPFGMMSTHSTWPVMIVCYNLPPSECMEKDFRMLTLLIRGPLGPNHNIDVYLQPLIDELNELWSLGTVTYDAHTKTDFTMRAMLLWCIHDFPAYAHVSGLRTSGRYGCPVCGENTEAFWLKCGSKFAYTGHRRFLRDRFHPYRKKTSQFNGPEDLRVAPRRLSGSELFNKTATADKEFGKLVKHPAIDSSWSKRSIFFSSHIGRMMRVYRVLGRNKNYIEGSITKQCGVNEGARHCAEILPDAKRKYLKCRGKIEMPCDAYEGPYPVGSQGKSCSLTNL
ncbi:uncharacterized protein LOC113289145 isoform X1 [Papaver somniferum]|uniref:uncharacterized protein LOC113289145 isoform X1 n=1 Tax=Papaver somniferum TaxID=3469 RepID=UPI000E6F6754|nr:uncharacterized protein LOC113289145 isoform X1 [Papaver somniferum]XP_026394108.1 uncharacterized protein LOC113289145 isoform X1 [Papaver somniferum]